MQTTYRDLITAMHGILFGGFFLLAGFAVAAELYRGAHQLTPAVPTQRGRRLEALFLWMMAGLGWLAVLSGTFVVYPWYRAAPPAGLKTLAMYPRSLLLSNPATAPLHSFGMEWKEHIGWFAPILATLVAFVLVRHRSSTQQNLRLRRAVITFAFVGLAATGVAGLTGALLDKSAPVTGGDTVTLGGGQ